MKKVEKAELVSIAGEGRSASNTRIKIGRWLRPLAFPFDDEQARAIAVSVRHASQTGRLTEVQTLKLPPNMGDDNGAVEAAYSGFVTSLDQVAIDDVEGTGGVQRYVMVALASDKSPIARLTIRYAATRTEGETEELDSEPSNIAGMLAQTMRHNEARERIDKAGWGTLIATQARTIETLSERLEQSFQRQMDFIETLEEVATARHQRDLEVMREEGKFKLKGDAMRQLTALMPAFAKKFGVDIGDSQHPDVMQFRSLMAGMSEEQINGLLSVLKPDQVIELLSLIKRQGEDGTDDAKLLAEAQASKE